MENILYDFEDGNGLVPAKQHANGGGWVADTAFVSADSYVAPYARVYGYAVVRSKSDIFHFAKIYGYATISKVKAGDYARVCGSVSLHNITIRNTEYVYDIVFSATRSDGYIFYIFKDIDGEYRISAGCRYFTIPEAYKHWTSKRGGTFLGYEACKIVDYPVEVQTARNKKDMVYK
jgi:hypothetical protein